MANDIQLAKAANNIRILAASMVEKAKSGHHGGAMGGADFVNVLFAEFLRYDPDNMLYPFRDRFFLDPGHMSPMLYSVLALAGHYSMEDLQQFRQWGSVTPGHPEVDFLRGVENTSGPLGQGHAMGLGAAIAERFMVARFGEWMAHKTYIYISDGAVQEEVSQGVGRIAGNLGLSNIIMYYDSNNVQLSTKVDEVDTEDVAMKYRAWGWNVIEIDGQSIPQIREALKKANEPTDKPTIIIGTTVMGKGAVTADGGSFEHMVSTHGQPLSAAGADYAATIANLGGNPEEPFKIFPEVAATFEARANALRQEMQERKAVETAWRQANPVLAHKMDMFFAGELPEINYRTIAIKSGSATRAASSTVLGTYADNLVFAAADMNGDNQIMINDVVQVINSVLGLNTTSVLTARNIVRETLDITETQSGFSMSLSNAAGYTAMQYDMTLPAGVSINDIRVTSGSNHSVSFREVGDGQVRVAVVSLTNEAFASGSLLEVSVSAESATSISITNAYAATRGGVMVEVADAEAQLTRGGATGIQAVGVEVAPADIFDLSGRIVKKAATSLEGLDKGVYLMNGKKVLVK